MVNIIPLLWLWIFEIYYSRSRATVLHGIPIVIFITVPFFLRLLNSGLHSWFATYSDFVKGKLASWFIFFWRHSCVIFCSSRAYWYWTSTFVKDFFNIVRFVYFAGMMIHATGKMLAIIFPIAFSVLRLLFSGYAMSWCAFWFTSFSIFWHTYDFLFFLCVGMKLCCMKSYILSHNNVYVIGIAFWIWESNFL